MYSKVLKWFGLVDKNQSGMLFYHVVGGSYEMGENNDAIVVPKSVVF